MQVDRQTHVHRPDGTALGAALPVAQRNSLQVAAGALALGAGLGQLQARVDRAVEGVGLGHGFLIVELCNFHHARTSSGL